MSDNQVGVAILGILFLAFLSFMIWVILRGPVERVQADGTPYPVETHWSDRDDFVGPLEPCFFVNSEGPAGSYTIATSKIRNKEIKWFGPDFNTAAMEAWLHKFGYFHA